MKTFKFNLLEEKTEYGFMPTLTAHLIDGNPSEKELRPAIVVIPGGGYRSVSYREGERIALYYNSAGFHTFILDYCVAPHKYPYPIQNAAKALELIRKNADEWNVDPDKVAVCGFSAGGHLAASISNLWNDSKIFPGNEEANLKHRPNATILSYPVITCGEFAHKWSFIRLTGIETENELWKELSMEKRVSENTPPTFLWHTYDDQVVPVENSMLYASALRRSGIPFELHIYPYGPHGLSRTTDEKYWGVPKYTRKYPWIDFSVEWLYLQFGIANIEKD